MGVNGYINDRLVKLFMKLESSGTLGSLLDLVRTSIECSGLIKRVSGNVYLGYYSSLVAVSKESIVFTISRDIGQLYRP